MRPEVRDVSEQDLRVRAATEDDAETIVDFNAAMAEETEDKGLDRQSLARGVATMLAQPSRGFYLIAERGGQVAGQLMVTYEWSDWRNGDFWWIQSVYVLPEHRRSGVYRSLHEAVVTRARESGACGVRLYVEQENEVAQQTYRSLAMSRTHYQLFETEF
jgi:ribosomal protein S18 acetylase RimI-like enzyme